MNVLPDPERFELPVSFLDRPAPAGFTVRSVTIPAGGELPYEPAEWVGSLLVVEAGRVELECVRGQRESFGAGSVICFDPSWLRAVRNPGPESALLSAVRPSSRR